MSRNHSRELEARTAAIAREAFKKTQLDLKLLEAFSTLVAGLGEVDLLTVVLAAAEHSLVSRLTRHVRERRVAVQVLSIFASLAIVPEGAELVASSKRGLHFVLDALETRDRQTREYALAALQNLSADPVIARSVFASETSLKILKGVASSRERVDERMSLAASNTLENVSLHAEAVIGTQSP
eukprot:CAMPEP_0206057686 /NCGR_PEP_ID=MMETSP1466-20131121/44873_1 /ASSEMBLY_ACC=CAM_ASM_001126 /TAXON_ID=44452 /ORGANISM="Pavlova gyrans, Strain CCMP608" /LENGTH=182 /DNA_ID=CAMNT_0053432961 /DNA_START=25 /DNA_END=570 /DNA_ORIENTATION=+